MSSTIGCEEVRLSLGAYVVGALDAAERSQVDLHLPGCAGCRDALASLAGLPGLLGRLSADEVVAGPPVAGPELLDRMLAAMRRSRRRRRSLLASAAAAVVIAGGGGTAYLNREEPGPRPVIGNAGPVSAAVTLGPKLWGTEVGLRLSGVQPGERCSLVAVSTDGRRETAATWAVTYRGGATVTGATSIQRTDLASVAVQTPDGRTLVQVPTPG